jgi:hypothetical protein
MYCFDIRPLQGRSTQDLFFIYVKPLRGFEFFCSLPQRTKKRSDRVPPEIYRWRKQSPAQPALPPVAEPVEALAEGGAQMLKIEANSGINVRSNLKLPFKSNYKKSVDCLV